MSRRGTPPPAVLKSVLIGFGVAVGLLATAVLGSLLLIESEEVVVIHTQDPEAESFETRVWIVDHEGAVWIAPGNRSNQRFERLRRRSAIELTRDGTTSCRVASVVKGDEALAVLPI